MRRREFMLLGGVLVVPACRSGVEAIDIRGSDSEISLVEGLTEAFMALHPDVAISVTGGGSGVGIASLLDGEIDLCTSSRELLPIERLLALRKRVEPVATVFATDALSVVVHEDNPLERIDLDTLAALYRGERATWAGLGPDTESSSAAEVVCYGRQSSSGTFEFFKRAVVHGDYAGSVRQMSGNAQVLEAVARDPGGIGYVTVGLLHSARALPIRALRVSATPESVATSPLDRAAVLAGHYPIARPLLQFTRGQPEGHVREFMLFELSPAGEAIVEAMGFYPVVHSWRERNRRLGVNT
ncbi:phosphate ABC transporter substrate-binding protein [Nannocystaceae bacterium ST9]